MNELNHIRDDVLRAQVILELADEEFWKEYFRSIENLLISDPREAANLILNSYGGSGTINDLVLYKNHQPLIDENDEFDEIRKRLYKLSKILLAESK